MPDLGCLSHLKTAFQNTAEVELRGRWAQGCLDDAEVVRIEVVRGTGRDAAVTGRTAGYSFSSQEVRGQAIVIYHAHSSEWLGKDVDSDGQLPLQIARASHQSLTCLVESLSPNTHNLCNAKNCLKGDRVDAQKVFRAFIQLQGLHGPSCDDVISY